MQTIHLGRKNAQSYSGPATIDDSNLLPYKMANESFMYVHYPTSWTYEPGIGFLPTLGKIKRKPGVNGVGDDLKMNRAIAGATSKGGTVIRLGDQRLGEFANYLIMYPTKHGKAHFCFMHVEFTILPNGRAVPRKCVDKWNEFRKLLCDSGYVSPMPDVVYDELLIREDEKVKRAGARNHKGQLTDAAYKQVVERRDSMVKAWETYCKALTKTSKKARTVKAKAQTVNLGAE